jgi:hypothetical protein
MGMEQTQEREPRPGAVDDLVDAAEGDADEVAEMLRLIGFDKEADRLDADDEDGW